MVKDLLGYLDRTTLLACPVKSRIMAEFDVLAQRRPIQGRIRCFGFNAGCAADR